MLKRLAIGACLIAAAPFVLGSAVFCVTYLWSEIAPYHWHFGEPLPSGSRLVHYTWQNAGIDNSYGFEFAVADRELEESLIARWELTTSKWKDHEDFTSAISTRPPAWWIDPGAQTIAQRFGRIDWDEQRYWSVWRSADGAALYVEYGDW